jgi:eukaryotic-like serine/threonine-protein kinase
MPETVAKEEAIFHAALAIDAADQRSAYLDVACENELELRRRVEALLRRCTEAQGPLDRPVLSPVATTDQPIAERPGTVIGPYKLLEQIGEGGFGVVFMAEQQQPIRRKVALKVLKPGMDTRQVIARFEAERQALALMDHPNIAKVHEAGETASGRPYFVMELVKGIPITDYCDQSQLSIEERLELFVPVCQAVQHAHQKGIIHRDIKPTNLLVTLHDGAPVVKVIDFGIAKALGPQLTEKTLYTGFAQMVGTPMYMSPEQAALSGLDMDTRSDIYSLGVLLYELLTGTTPFDKERLWTAAYDEMRRIIREEEPAKPSTRISTLGQAANTASLNRKSDPRRLSQLFRGELDWIVMKALEKDRNRRYETANALAADVQRYLNDEPVLACPPSAAYRFRKFARRNRGPVLAASLVLFALVVGVMGTTIGLLRAEQQRWNAEKNEQKALAAAAAETSAKDEQRREAYFQRITVAHRELSLDNLAAALRALHDCPKDLRGWEWHYLMRLCVVEPLVIRDKTEVIGVAFSPDGEQLASAGGDGAVRIWNSRTGKRVREFPAHGNAACSVAFHPKGQHLASSGADGLVRIWDLTADPPDMVFQGPCETRRKFGVAYTVAFSPDGRQLAAGSDGRVKVWDWKNRPEVPELTFPGHNKFAISVAFSRDGKRLASASSGEGVYLCDAQAEGPPLRTFPAHHHPVSALAFSPDGGWLAEANYDGSVKLWNAATGELGRSLPHTGNVECVAFSPDGQRLASAGVDKTVRIWDATRLDEKQEPREVLGLRGHMERCVCVAFSPDGHRLASASHDGTIRVWDATPLRVDEGQEVHTFPHDVEIRSVAVSPDGRRIASAGMGTQLTVCDLATRKTIPLDIHAVTVFCLAWQPDGERIASAAWNGRLNTVQFWDVRDGREVQAPSPVAVAPGRANYAVVFSPDGRFLVTGEGSAVNVWDARTGREIGPLGTHDREIRAVVFSPKGGHLASASGDGKVKLWDATRLSDKQEPRIPPIQARVPWPSVNVAFSPDGQRLATGGEENTVKIWDVQTGELLQTLRGHNGDIYAVAFSPEDGRWIASGGEDSAVKVWDSHTGKIERTFRGHTGIVSSLAFCQGGSRLVSGSWDKTVKVWDVSRLSEVPVR